MWKMTIYVSYLMFLFVSFFIFMFILQDSFCYWVTFACKKQVEKEVGAFEQTFPVFRFGIGWHYTARRFVISFTFYKFTTHDLMNITLLYFIIPFCNCLLVSLHFYYSNSHSLRQFIYNNYHF